MSKQGLGVTAGILLVLLAVLIASAIVNLKYIYAAPLFFIVAALLAPVAIHKVPEANLSTGLLVGLSIFAAQPVKKLFQLDGFIAAIAVTFAFMGVFWVIGFGWKRSWR